MGGAQGFMGACDRTLGLWSAIASSTNSKAPWSFEVRKHLQFLNPSVLLHAAMNLWTHNHAAPLYQPSLSAGAGGGASEYFHHWAVTNGSVHADGFACVLEGVLQGGTVAHRRWLCLCVCWQVTSRAVGILQPLVLGWTSLASSGLLPKGLNTARAALQVSSWLQVHSAASGFGCVLQKITGVCCCATAQANEVDQTASTADTAHLVRVAAYNTGCGTASWTCCMRWHKQTGLQTGAP